MHGGFTAPQPLEPSLVDSQAAIRWCEHLVIATPNWWSSVPALLKGFIDRVFLPGFAVEYLEGFPYSRKLLKGRSAPVIYTQNAPQWLTLLALRISFGGPCDGPYWDTAASARCAGPCSRR